jgi:Glycosyl hydrolase family 26
MTITKRALVIWLLVLVPDIILIGIVGVWASSPGAKLGSGHANHRPARHVSPSLVNGSIYWGAYIQGEKTYRHLYGGTWGNVPWDARTWKKFERNAGKRVSIVHWGMNRPMWRRDFNYWRSSLELVRRAGALNAVDLTTRITSLRDIAAGRYDSAITRWMRQAAAWKHPFFLNFDPEMNGNWKWYSPGLNGHTASDFVNMWRHVHDLAVRAGATNITWIWTVNIDPRSGFIPLEQLYPGDAYVDWTGLNGYNAEGRRSFSWLFSSTYERLVKLAPTKPVAIMELAAEDGPGKAAWISDALAEQLPANFPQVKALIWFNWRIRSGGQWRNWEIESSPSSQAAFAAAISSPYYAPGGPYRNLPLLTKIKPPA